MAASYPTTAKSFSTKLTNDTIEASHVNDLQDEMNAVETAMLTGGLAHDLDPDGNNTRSLGSAAAHWKFNDSVTEVSLSVCDGRLTLTSGTPVTTADVTAATTLYYALHVGNRIALYDGTNWNIRTFAELSIAVPATTSTMYDVFVYDNSGTATLELTAWTNDTTRATALTRQNGVLVKTGATTRRYLGSFRTTTVSGQTEDSVTKRYVWNYYHRVPRVLDRHETTASWTYTTATWRQANGAAANQVDVVVGVAEVLIDLTITVPFGNSGGGVGVSAGIGEDSTTATVSGWATYNASAGTGIYQTLAARGVKAPAVGRHYYAWLEYSTAAGTTTFLGADNGHTGDGSGLMGWIEG